MWGSNRTARAVRTANVNRSSQGVSGKMAGNIMNGKKRKGMGGGMSKPSMKKDSSKSTKKSGKSY